jgi:AraC-like DNA-binding protein
MFSIHVRNGFDATEYTAIPCEDGGGRMDCYSLFDGVTVIRVELETHSFREVREEQDMLEINFCASGRFESQFSAHDRVTLTPGDMAVSTFDGMHGTSSESVLPLGHYAGLCLTVNCAQATAWMHLNVPAIAVDFQRLWENLLGTHWFAAMNAGPRCEHVFRELMENLAYFDRPYLTLKAIELFTLLGSIPRAELDADYTSAAQIRLAQHLRDHLLSDHGRSMTLAELADAHHISVSYLQKLFRQVFGTSVHRYIREYRLEQAALELSSSEKRIVEIALDAGYESAGKFTDVFKRRYGMTPTDYRSATSSVPKRNSESKME